MEHSTSENKGSSTYSNYARVFLQKVSAFLVLPQTVLVALVFLLGFIVRAQLMRYELFFEFDSYWHARMVSYMLQGLPPQLVDPLGYYHNIAAATLPDVPVLFWYISTFFYKLFTLNAPYDLEKWILIVKILPAFYGALVAVAMYFLGKELFKGPHEKAAGFLAGIFAGIIPAFVYRTMGGFFEDDSLGFLWMVIGFVFFVKAMREPAWKKENILNALFAGLSFALMVFTWPAFNMLVPILLGVGVVQFLLWLREKEYTHASAFAKLWLIVFALLGVAATIHTGTFWLVQFGGILGGLFFRNTDAIQLPGVLVFLAGLFAAAFILLKSAKHGKIPSKWVNYLFTIIVLGIVLAPFAVYLFNISLNINGSSGQSIGEESEGRVYFGNKYSMLLVFLFVGLPAVGYLLLRRPRHFESLALSFVWVIVAFFLAWGKLKFTFYLGLPLALMSMVVCVLALKWGSGQSVQSRKIVALIIGFFVISGIAAGTFFVTQNVPNIEGSPGWKTALFWANEHLPADAKFFNWWDEGHWISFLSNRGVVIDNRNADPKAATDVAAFILSEDQNTAAALVTKYGSTHLIFGDDLLSKMGSLVYYAYQTVDRNDPRVQGILGATFPCSRDVAPLTKEVKYTCGSNAFSQNEFESLPTRWQSSPNIAQQGASYNVYRNEDNSHLYIFSPRSNNAMLVRLWMGDPALEDNFVEIYRNREGVRIYQVEAPSLVSDNNTLA